MDVGFQKELFATNDRKQQAIVPKDFITFSPTIESGIEHSTICYSAFNSIFGEYFVGSIQTKICLAAFGQGHFYAQAKQYYPNNKLQYLKNEIHEQAYQYLKQEPLPDNKIVLQLKATSFQLKVWELLMSIATGQHRSYCDLALLLGSIKHSRAVGTALARNPIAYLIPCHRIMRSDGKINGYRWGSDLKLKLLKWESNFLS